MSSVGAPPPPMPKRLSKAERRLHELVDSLDQALGALFALEVRDDAPAMIEEQQNVRRLQAQIRSHCEEHGLPLPPNAGLDEDE